MKTCRNCHKDYEPKVAQEWYCPDCKEIVRRAKHALYNRRWLRRKKQGVASKKPLPLWIWCEGYGDVTQICDDGYYPQCLVCVHKSRSTYPDQPEYLEKFKKVVQLMGYYQTREV